MSIAWYSLSCPRCRARLRIREEYASRRGRCPECGYRIDAPRPQAPAPIAAPAPADDEDPPLVPMDEEWPEPAQVEADDSAGVHTYDVTEVPKSWPEDSPAPVAPAAPAIPGYEVVDGWTAPPSPAPAPLADSYDVGAVPSTRSDGPAPLPYRLTRAERDPLRAPPPPSRPLLEGIYLFPWQAPSNLRVWLLLTLGCVLVIVFAIAVWFFYLLIVQQEKAGAFLPLPLAALLIIGAITGGYGGSIFLAIVQDTAAGNRDVRWPDDAFLTRFLQFGYLGWVFSCAAWPVGILLLIQPAWMTVPWIAVPLALLPVMLFPVLFLSSLSAQKAWVLLHHRLLGRLLRRLPATVCVIGVSSLLAAISGYLGYWNVVRFEYLLTPLTAGVWSASTMIYARLLGRLAWLLSRER